MAVSISSGKIHILLTPYLVSSALSWSSFNSSWSRTSSWFPAQRVKNWAICSDVASGIRFKTSVGVGGSSSVNWHSTSGVIPGNDFNTSDGEIKVCLIFSQYSAPALGDGVLSHGRHPTTPIVKGFRIPFSRYIYKIRYIANRLQTVIEG